MRHALLIALAAIVAFQAQRSFAQPATQPDDQGKETIIVTTAGTGADEKAALKQAFSNAITQAIGTIVDAETIVKNDQIIKDQVITASNAIITHWEPIGSPQVENGLITVKIQATILKKQLSDRLAAANVVKKAFEGKDLFAQVVTELQNEKDAAVVIRKVFMDFPGNVMKAEPGKYKVLSKTDNSVSIQVDVELSFDMDKYGLWYDQFAPQLKRVLKGREEVWSIQTAKTKKELPENGLLSPEQAREAIKLPAKGIKTWQEPAGIPTLAVYSHQGSCRVMVLSLDRDNKDELANVLLTGSARPTVELTLADENGHEIDTEKAIMVIDRERVQFGNRVELQGCIRCTPFWFHNYQQNILDSMLAAEAEDPTWALNVVKLNEKMGRGIPKISVFPYFYVDGDFAAPKASKNFIVNLSLDQLARVKSIQAKIYSQTRTLQKPKQ